MRQQFSFFILLFSMLPVTQTFAAPDAYITTLDQAAQLCPALNGVVFQPTSNSPNQGRLVAVGNDTSTNGTPYCSDAYYEQPANLGKDGLVQGIAYAINVNTPELGYGFFNYTLSPWFINCFMSYQGISGNQIQVTMSATSGRYSMGICTPPSITTNVKADVKSATSTLDTNATTDIKK